MKRDGELVEFDVALNEEGPALGVGFAFEENYIAVSPVDAVVSGVAWPLVQTQQQLAGLAGLITGKSSGEVGGPSAIVKTIKGSADRGAIAFLEMAALISTVLGLFNLLPLPALDGGRLMFMFYEVIFRRPANKVVEGWVHAVGIIALLGFIGFVEVRAAARAVTSEGPNFFDEVQEAFDHATKCEARARKPKNPGAQGE
jgi:regulator of sigma E protease